LASRLTGKALTPGAIKAESAKAAALMASLAEAMQRV
jgi:hypothetical protein